MISRIKINNILNLFVFALWIVTIAAFTACSNKARKDTSERIITVTIEPQRYFAEAIAGDKFTIHSMVPQGSSPETYDPTPQQLVSLSESEAYFRIGHIGFEVSWMKRLQENNPHLRVFDLSKGVELIHEGGHQHGDHYHAGGVEPHIWNSTTNAKIIAKNILDTFVELDKANQSYYQSRYDSLIHEIGETDETVFNLLKENADHAFMIYHPALSYFARDYNLHQIPIEEAGKEPSPSYLKDLVDLARFEEVRVIFIQPEFDQRNAEVIAKETNARIVRINPLSYDWKEEMIRVATELSHK